MSFVDIAFLEKGSLKDGQLIYKRKKTGKELSLRNKTMVDFYISVSYRVVSHFGQYHVEGLKGVTLDNKEMCIRDRCI